MLLACLQLLLGRPLLQQALAGKLLGAARMQLGRLLTLQSSQGGKRRQAQLLQALARLQRWRS